MDDIEVVSPITAKAEIKKYTLVGDDIYIRRYTNDTIPTWYKQLISDIIASDNTILDVNSAIAYLSQLSDGYSTIVSELREADTVTNTYMENLKATVSGHSADINTLQITKVDSTGAAAIASNIVGAWFDDNRAGAWFNSKISTYASEVTAQAMNISTLSSMLNNTTVKIDTVEEVIISEIQPALISIVDNLVPSLQNQIDGSITTWFNEGVPTINSYPSNEWQSNDTLFNHIGDIYYDRDTGYGYRFAYEDIEDTPDMGVIYSWIRITDVDVVKALADAANAQDTADGKRAIYTGSIIPTGSVAAPLSTGDIWIPSSNVSTYTQGEVYLYVEGSVPVWVARTRYTAAIAEVQQGVVDWIAGDYAIFVADIQGQVDGKAESYYVDTMPHPEGTSTTYAVWVGDLWKQPSTNDEYVYVLDTGVYKWFKTDVPDIVYDTIDTKKSIYSGNSVPVAIAPDIIEVNDMWITGSNPVFGYEKESIYVWNGTGWIKPLKYTDDSATVSLQNGLINGTVSINLANATINGTKSFFSYVAEEIDKKVAIYSGESAPVAGQPIGVAANDIYLWFTTASKVLANGTTQTYDITRTYKYSDSAWAEITTDSNITALADLADGKRTVFSGSTLPTGAVARDIWIPSANNATYLAGEIYQYTGSVWSLATRYSADITALSTNLQGQIDGKVETYYQATVPTGMLAVNNGDYWYCTADVSTYKKGKIYKYTHATKSWAESADVSRYAFDIADGKATIFTTAAKPNTYKKNDLLIVLTADAVGTYSAGVVLTAIVDRTTGVFTASDWTKQINDTEDLDAFVSVVNPKVDALKAQLDGSISYYFQLSTAALPSVAWTTDALKNTHHADLLYFTDTKVAKRYSAQSNAWYDAADMTEVLAKIATSQATADGKATVYYKTTADINAITATWTTQQKLDNVGDVWIDSSTGVSKIWNTTTWVNVATVDANTALSKLADLEEARDGVVDTFYVTTAPVSGMSYGDYWVDTDSWTGTAYVVYRYEALDGSSTGTLAWRVNTGETAVALGKAYRADVAGSAAFTAQTTANTASTNATNALNKITDMASDNILSPVEKPSIVAEYNVITTEQSGIDSQATSYGITTEKTTYDTAVSALTTYLGTLTSPVVWNTLTGDTKIVGTTFRGKFNDVYTTRQTLLNAITSKAKLLADTAQGTADGKIKTWYQTTAPVLTASDVGDIWVDTDNGNVTYVWSGTTWITTSTEDAKSAYSWSANASKLITSPDGSITGWSFGDGSSIKSYFKINANNFSISDGITGYTPFSIKDNKISFNGVVSFTNTTGNLTTAQQQGINTANLTNGAGWTTDALAASKPNTYYQAVAPSSTGRVDGDIWIDSDDKNQMYRWNGTSWVSVRDTAISDVSTMASAAQVSALSAMSAAQEAKAIADGAIRTFYQATAPTGLNDSTNLGDLWFDTDDGQAYRWNGTSWVIIEDNSIAVALSAAQSAQTTADGKITAFYQTSAPTTGMEIGDLWYDTDDNNKAYYYTGSAWSTVRDGTIAIAQSTANIASVNASDALAELDEIASDSKLTPVEKLSVRKEWDSLVREKASIEAQATTYLITIEKTNYVNALVALGTYLNDGTAWTFSTTTIPSWIADTSLNTVTNIVGSTFRSNFTAYYTARQNLMNKVNNVIKSIADSKVLAADVANAINTNTTTIDGGKITTGSITTNQLTTGIALINGSVISSDFTTIGGAGFRLKSNAAGTSADPTIYGAYIKGGTLDSSTLNVRNLKVITDSGNIIKPIQTISILCTEESLSERIVSVSRIPVLIYPVGFVIKFNMNVDINCINGSYLSALNSNRIGTYSPNMPTVKVTSTTILTIELRIGVTMYSIDILPTIYSMGMGYAYNKEFTLAGFNFTMERGMLSLNTSTINTTSIGEITLSSPNATFSPVQTIEPPVGNVSYYMHSATYGKYVPILVSNI